MIAFDHGDVVERLDAGVVVFDRNEVGHAKAIAVDKIHARIGEGPAGVGIIWANVGARAIFAGNLEAELVGGRRGQQRQQAAVESVRPVLFYGVGAAGPRIHVKGAVFLFGPSVVVFEGGVVRVR